MAATVEIAQVRLNVNEPDDSNGYTDDIIGTLIDGLHGVRPASASIWESKAGRVADLVNMSEGGSSRSLGDIHDHYLAMWKQYTGDEGAGGVPAPVSRTAYRV